MNTSLRAPQRGHSAPYLLHLERVCRMIEMGASFATIEFNPNCDIVHIVGPIQEGVKLRIREGGDVSIIAHGGAYTYNLLGLTLGNYKRIWRIWQGGIPSDAQRRSARWG